MTQLDSFIDCSLRFFHANRAMVSRINLDGSSGSWMNLSFVIITRCNPASPLA